LFTSPVNDPLAEVSGSRPAVAKGSGAALENAKAMAFR